MTTCGNSATKSQALLYLTPARALALAHACLYLYLYPYHIYPYLYPYPYSYSDPYTRIPICTRT